MKERERERGRGSGNEEKEREREKGMQDAYDDVKHMLTGRTDILKTASPEVLLAMIEKKCQGENVRVDDIKDIQIEVQREEEEREKEKQQREVQRLLERSKTQLESLDVALKVKQAREQQALQKRLLQRKAKKAG
eukprot:CAMPEP_0182437930 /NCGR_PEP_ID=MMETSP1167-20130531/85381_1 /TAXON_ID=2988 /ORGANISM="Mallomonas Sp, Strain CCMP3275" /LENGTH=134 /DNA_ID=CAMNT_0024631029 /DNA_START=897 /DNA_END=1301 /DNA_ORIENTATION=-